MTVSQVIIFGTGPSADVAMQMFEECTSKRVKCFTVDREYIRADSHNGRPLIPFDELAANEDRHAVEFFVSVGYSQMNQTRKIKFSAVKEHGFKVASLVHPKVNLPSDFVAGENCFIMNDVHIHPCVEIGDDNFIWSGTTLCHHVKVGSHCWFTSGSMVAGNTRIGNQCFFGIGSVLTNNLTIGNECFVGAGALVSADMSSNQVVIRAADVKHRLNSNDFLTLINNRF
jgi:sugar O-acyltransferase (sialic acid O-acetyltransferase NeuD family)